MKKCYRRGYLDHRKSSTRCYVDLTEHFSSRMLDCEWKETKKQSINRSINQDTYYYIHTYIHTVASPDNIVDAFHWSCYAAPFPNRYHISHIITHSYVARSYIHAYIQGQTCEIWISYRLPTTTTNTTTVQYTQIVSY